MRTNLLLGAAAVGVLITGAIAQTSSSIERIRDPAGQQNSARDTEAKKNVRTVYPNTQNAEQAAQQNKSAQGRADANKRQPGDVVPLPNGQQPQASPPPAPQTAQPSPQPAQPSNAPPATQQPAPTATAAQPSTPSQPAAAPPSRTSRSIIALDTQQQTSVGQAIAQRGVKPLTNVDFSIAVGTKVPAPVQLRALPADVVTFVPQYRGYSYVVVEEQIVIVDPGTQEIVAIVPYTAAAPASRVVDTPKPATPAAEKPMTSRAVNLNAEEKTVSRRPTTEQRKRTTRSVSKREYREERVPRTATIEEGIEPSRLPVFRGHRFIDDDDDVPPRPNGFFGFFR